MSTLKFINKALMAAALLTAANVQAATGQKYSTWQEWNFTNAQSTLDGFFQSNPEVLMTFDANGDMNPADGFDGSGVVPGANEQSVFLFNAVGSFIDPTGEGSFTLPPDSTAGPGQGAFLWVENWIDTQSRKEMHIEITGEGFSTILAVQFLQAVNSGNGGPPVVIPFSQGVNPIFSNFVESDTMFAFDAVIFPNPDWELLKLRNLGGTNIRIDQIQIHTVSLPEPATYSMLGLCIGLLGVARLRKHKV